MKIYYFGTSLTDHGHYTFEIENGYMRSAGLLPKDVPFNPESLTENLKRGQSVIYHVRCPLGDVSVWAIYGSPVDQRGGVKSVFWIKGIEQDIINIISADKKCKEILDAIK